MKKEHTHRFYRNKTYFVTEKYFHCVSHYEREMLEMYHRRRKSHIKAERYFLRSDNVHFCDSMRCNGDGRATHTQLIVLNLAHERYKEEIVLARLHRKHRRRKINVGLNSPALLINTTYRVLLHNLCAAPCCLVVPLVFATHRELQWLEVVDTCSKCVPLNYSRLITVSISGGGDIPAMWIGSPFDFRSLSGRNSGILQAIWQSGQALLRKVDHLDISPAE